MSVKNRLEDHWTTDPNKTALIYTALITPNAYGWRNIESVGLLDHGRKVAIIFACGRMEEPSVQVDFYLRCFSPSFLRFFVYYCNSTLFD